jgi:hypothetical protein
MMYLIWRGQRLVLEASFKSVLLASLREPASREKRDVA